MTSRGRRTRAKIVDATADLVFEHGAAGTSLDDVREATGTSKSQLFHYFPSGKKELLAAVVERQTERVLDAQRPALDKLDSWAALRRWRNGVIALQRQLHCAGGCPIGSMADELAEHDPQLRAQLAESFATWQGYIERGLTEMRDRGELRRDAAGDPRAGDDGDAAGWSVTDQDHAQHATDRGGTRRRAGTRAELRRIQRMTYAELRYHRLRLERAIPKGCHWCG